MIGSLLTEILTNNIVALEGIHMDKQITIKEMNSRYKSDSNLTSKLKINIIPNWTNCGLFSNSSDKFRYRALEVFRNFLWGWMLFAIYFLLNKAIPQRHSMTLRPNLSIQTHTQKILPIFLILNSKGLFSIKFKIEITSMNSKQWVWFLLLFF